MSTDVICRRQWTADSRRLHNAENPLAMSRIQRTPFPLPLVWLPHHFAARLGLGPSPETPASPPSRPSPARSHTITLFAIFSTSLIFCTRPSPQRLDDGSPPLFGPDGFLQPGLIYGLTFLLFHLDFCFSVLYFHQVTLWGSGQAKSQSWKI